MRLNAQLPDRDLAYFEDGQRFFADYVRAVVWAQRHATLNREVLMLRRVFEAARTGSRKRLGAEVEAVNCHPDGFQRCSHGAGHAMSRGEARLRFTLADHRAAAAGVECRKVSGVIDETPAADKDIDAVMAAHSDLVEVVHTPRQVVGVKG